MLPPGAQVVAGLELGGVPLATMVSQLSGLPTLFVRKAPKDYGTRRLAEGGQVSGRRLAVIEDVVTSGGQIIESCAALRADGADNLASHDLELRSLFTLSQLRRAVGVATDR